MCPNGKTRLAVQAKAKLTCTMQQVTIQMGQTMPTAVSSIGTAVENIKTWLGGRAETFSRVLGEDFTHMEVLKAHLLVAAVFMAAIIGQWLEGGAL